MSVQPRKTLRTMCLTGTLWNTKVSTRWLLYQPLEELGLNILLDHILHRLALNPLQQRAVQPSISGLRMAHPYTLDLACFRYELVNPVLCDLVLNSCFGLQLVYGILNSKTRCKKLFPDIMDGSRHCAFWPALEGGV